MSVLALDAARVRELARHPETHAKARASALPRGGWSYRKRNVIGESSLFAPSIFTHPVGIHPHYVLKLQELVVFSRLLVLRHSGSELDQAHKH